MKWDRQKVLVTGGASFIGSHLVERLVKEGAYLRVADDLSSGTLDNLIHVRKDIEFHQGDMNDRDFAKKMCGGIDRVFMLAAIHGGRGFIYSHPADCASSVMIDVNTIKQAHAEGAKHITFASTACVYDPVLQMDGKAELLTEDMIDFDKPLKADEEYGEAKLYTERTLRAYYKQYGLQSASCRFSTVYGPRENETHAVIALIAKTFVRQDPFEIWGTGNQSRNFTYVDDIVEGIIRASERINDAEAVNLGSKELYSINQVVETILSIIGWHPSKIKYLMDKPTGVHCRTTGDDKAKQLLGIERWTSLTEGLERTINWYVKTKKREEVLTKLQILLTER